MPDVTEIRSPLDVEKLTEFLTNIPTSVTTGTPIPSLTAPFNVKQFSFGQSNPTYLVRDASGTNLVLRRKPTANAKLVSKSAHAIEREFFVLEGISKCNSKVEPSRRVPVPDVYLLCEDESVLGAVFYVMEFVDGRPITRPEFIPQENEREYWEAILTTIAAIHSVNCDELVKQLPAKHFPQFQPDKLAKSKGGPTYFQRQIKTLTAVAGLQAKTVDPIPDFNKISGWTLSQAPKDPDSLTLVHGDCKIDNFMFHPTEPRVIAVLDWELCTFGHPLFDLANFLQPYILPQQLNRFLLQPTKTDLGIEDPKSAEKVNEVLTLYQDRLGHPWQKDDLSNNPIHLWRLGAVFGLLRLCVISQGVAMRVANKTASSAKAAAIAGLYKPLSELAVDLIDRKTKL